MNCVPIHSGIIPTKFPSYNSLAGGGGGGGWGGGSFYSDGPIFDEKWLLVLLILMELLAITA